MANVLIMCNHPELRWTEKRKLVVYRRKNGSFFLLDKARKRVNLGYTMPFALTLGV